MATVGDLRVNISTNTSSFNRGMQDVNRQLKVAQAEFRNASTSLKDFGKGTDGLRVKSDYLTKSVDLQKQKVQALKEQYEKSKAATGENSKETQNLAVQYNNAQAKLNNLERDLKQTNDTLKLQTNGFMKLSNELTAAGKKMQAVGDKMTGIGKSLSAKVTAPIVAIGTAATKMSIDFEDSLAKVSTIADTTQIPMADLRKEILKLSNDTGIAATEIANNVYDAISAGQKTGDAVNFVSNSTKLAKAGFAEAGQSLDLLTTIMNAYELEATEVTRVSDVLINTQNLGKTTVGELSQSMGKVIPTAKAFGVNLEQVASGYAIMTAKGIKSAETTTYMASMFNELGKSGTKASDIIKEVSGKSFQELIASGKSVGDVLAMMDTYAKKNNLSLADLFGSAEAGKAALLLANNVGQDFNNMLKDMNNVAGKTDEAFDKVANTTGEKFRKSLNQLKNAGIQLGDALAPVITKIADLFAKLTEKLNSLNPAQLETIAKIGMMVAAIGPLLIIGGKVAAGIGSLLTLFGTISGAIAVMTTGVAAATPAIGALAAVFTFLSGTAGIVIAAIAVVTTAVVALYKHFSKASLEVEEFGDEVSESTQKAMGAYEELDNNVGQSLMNMKIKHEKVSKEAADSITANFAEMSNQITTKMNESFNADYETMSNFMTKSGALRDADNQEILNKMQEQHNFEVQIVEQGNARVDEIMRTAAAQNRELTTQEWQEVNTIKEHMMTDAINTMSQGEIEQKSLLERQKQNASIISAEQAAEVVKNSAKQRDEVIAAAEEEYDKTVQAIIRERDEKGTIKADEAEKLISAAKHQKEESVNSAQGMHQEIVFEAQKQAEEHINNVDWETGEIKTKWQVMKDDISTKAEEIKTNISTTWNNVKETTSETWNNMKETTSAAWGEIQSKIDEHGGGIKGTLGMTMDYAKTGWEQCFNAMDNITGGTMSAIKSKVEEHGGGIRGIIGTTTDYAKTGWEQAFTAMDNVTGGKLSSMVDKVSRGLDSVKNFFANLRLPEIKIPHIKLPHISVTGEFSIKPPRVPDFDVSWYHDGGIFTRPTVLGGIGVGDAYKGSGSNAEAVLPLDVLWREQDKNFERLEQKLNSGESGTFIFPIYMDSEKISEYTYKKVDGNFALAGKRVR